MAKAKVEKTSSVNMTCVDKECGKGCCGGAGGIVYALGFVGAAVHYISTATGFWIGVLGVLKAIVWPAFVVYGLLKQLGL